MQIHSFSFDPAFCFCCCSVWIVARHLAHQLVPQTLFFTSLFVALFSSPPPSVQAVEVCVCLYSLSELSALAPNARQL